MEVSTREVKSILTEQKKGFAATGPFPFTHTLSPYTGCAFGSTTCGLYCYAQYMPNWTYHANGLAWGSAVQVKINAPEILAQTLGSMQPETRSKLRIFMASTTDPYQPLESTYRITRQCLEVFAAFDDLDLLVVQTRSALVERDFELIRRIPYAWLSVTIETDDQDLLKRLRGGPPVAKRLAVIRAAHDCGIKTQIAVSPCMPHTDRFGDKLLQSGADRFIVDTFVEGDGSRGKRTAHSPYASFMPGWSNTEQPRMLFERLKAAGANAGWSAAGFSGIPPRRRDPACVQGSLFEA